MGLGEFRQTAQLIHETETSARHDLGYDKPMEDGRCFVYALAGEAIAAGDLCVAPDAVSNHEDMAVAAAAAVGATKVTVTLGATAVAADQYAQGTLQIIDGAGEGHTYGVKSHPAADASASLVVTLVEPIVVALTTATSKVSLYKHACDGVQKSNTDQADRPVGVAPVAFASGEYGWLQTDGHALALVDTPWTRGQAVTIGSGTAGALMVKAAATEPDLGVGDSNATTSERDRVILNIPRP